MRTWIDELGGQVSEVLRTFWGEVGPAGFLPLLRPVAPFDQPSFLAPAVAIGGLVSFLLLSGVAVGALGALLLALVAIYLLMVQVFGLSIELHPFGRVAV